jgi:signal transduction histidine kinase/DNA-binding LacI/PurR family transcriptional regulator/AraC-like DNA-binding protein/DNA-binding LytR/AlgR family response regulator
MQIGCKIYLMVKKFRHGRPTIGVLVGWQVYWTPTPYSYLNPIFHGISAAAEKHGCNLLLACGMGSAADASDPARPAWPVPSNDTDFVPVGPWNTDGLIVANPLLSETRSRYVHDLMATGHPIVFIGDGEGQPAIVVDNAGGISQAVRHLFAHGHRQFAFISGNPGDMDGDSGGRLRAFQSTLRECSLNTSDELIADGHHTFPGGHAAMKQILASQIPFTAVLASNDESALGAMRALKEAGLQIPQDIAIIGFDDRTEAVAQIPPLTSIHVPLFKSGYQALELLLQHVRQEKEAPQLVKIATRLAIRQSCGCHPGSRVISTAPSLVVQPVDLAGLKVEIVQAMTEAVLAETQRFGVDDTQVLCGRLVDGFVLGLEKGDAQDFRLAVEDVLVQVELAEDDAHIWQSAISILRRESQSLIDVLRRPPAAQTLALDILDQARDAISERMQWQHGRYVLDHKWISNRVGLLTARLSTALTESQIFDVLTNDLSAMDIRHASISLFKADGDDPVAWSLLRAIPDKAGHPIRFPTRDFPPPGLLHEPDQAFSLALLPLVSQVGMAGFVAFDSFNIELNGPITQQIAAALNSAQLYAEATEGRKLAEEANRLKSRFLSMVSHELRTPLNLIVGLSEMLLQKREQNKKSPPGSYRKDIEQIYGSAQHLGRLIRDVLDLASSEVGQLRLDNELLDLTETLEMVVSTGRRLAHEKGLGWQDSLPETSLWVWGDRTRLRQVALNLVSNAVKFTSRGEVKLQVTQWGDKAIVLVSDTGLGIRPAEQKLIFDEFRRSETVTSRGYGGLGLGLAICKRLMELHGGEIDVESSGEDGAGSTFHFSLPLIEPGAIHKENKPLPLNVEQTVLLLTNQFGSGERLRDHLTQKGFEVNMVQAEQSDDWLSSLLRNPPGAIVVDVEIAPAQGWNTLRKLKENSVMRAVPLLFYSLAEDKGAMLELDYLTKPIQTAELAQALEYQKLISDEMKAEKVFLIVDDDPATLEMHVRIVHSQLGAHQVLKARNGREALQLMQEQRPDIVLLDLMMPELDGFGVLEAMREIESLRDIPVIVLTGQILTESEMARLNRGVATVLGKGLFSVQETLSHIDAALARKRKLGSEAQRLVRQAMVYLHQHYAESISRKDLAHYLGMSSDYLTYSFRREVGMTPIAYLNRYRINQAKSLLEETDKNVTEIAMLVGFFDSGYFSRVFRRQVGVSPDAYRRTGN